MAKYQFASDAFDGLARSGVIRSDGKWVPCEADNSDWQEYCDWLAAGNHPEPFRSVENGGFAIKVEENQVAVGTMLDSLRGEPVPPPAHPHSLTTRSEPDKKK